MRRTKRSSATARHAGTGLDPAIATAFKTEADARGVPVKELFEEMWEPYPERRPKAKTS